MYLKKIKVIDFQEGQKNCRACFFCYRQEENKKLYCSIENPKKGCIKNKNYLSYQLVVERF